MLFSHGPKVFLVLDSYRVTERDGSSINADITDDTKIIRKIRLFSDNLAVVLDFLILQDKHNIRTLSLNY